MAEYPKLVRNIIKCNKCGDIIESTHRHDFRWCSCGAVAIDGGLAYEKRVGHRTDWTDMSEYEPTADDTTAIGSVDFGDEPDA